MEINLIYNGLLRIIKEIRKKDNENNDLLTEFVVATNRIAELGSDLLENNMELKEDELVDIKDYYAYLEGYLEGLIKSIGEISWIVKKMKCPNCTSSNSLTYNNRTREIKCTNCENVLTVIELL